MTEEEIHVAALASKSFFLVDKNRIYARGLVINMAPWFSRYYQHVRSSAHDTFADQFKNDYGATYVDHPHDNIYCIFEFSDDESLVRFVLEWS